MSLLDDLNPGQREAVLASEPVAVVAGAGTGKTRVITYRVAWLISEGTPPDAILAVTFTNKAAGEMKERIARLAPSAGVPPWVGTFHSFCARLLRRDGPRIGIPRDFTIYNADDQASVVRQALAQLGRDERRWSARSMLETISFAKTRGWGPEELRREAIDERGRIAADVFDIYRAALKQASALDFDDLLLEAVRLLRADDEARLRWSRQFQHIVVDEFQDVNEAQYEMVRLLAGAGASVCVVGDEDQSIYSWRGADPRILNRFLDDFPGARVVRVETNYRSTQTILDAAGAVVAHNTGRLGKHLQATRSGEAPVRFHEADNSAAEAGFVVGEIAGLLRRDPEARIAVLYRANFQSRPFEEECRRAGIRFRLVGGFGFYQRAEVKDLLAYARLVLHPDDDVALARVINTPPRGIGKTTLDSLRAAATANHTSLWAAVGDAARFGSARAAAALRNFREMIEPLIAERDRPAAGDLLRELAHRTGYLAWLDEQDRAEFTDRAGNLKELVAAAEEAQERGESLADFLDRAALVSDVDSYDEHAPLTLMTLHSAKGLEFDHVYLVGLEEGLFPHSRGMAAEGGLEEERRLCYVGMTRPRKTLTLTRARNRRLFDRPGFSATSPSCFLAEIPAELVETVRGSFGRYSPGLPFDEAAQPDYDEAPPPRSSRASTLAAREDSLVGQRVRHPTFGIGTVVSIEDDGEDRRFVVSFPSHGTRKLIERYAKLERV